MLQFESLRTLENGFELDGVFVGAGDPKYQAIVTHIEGNNTADPNEKSNREARDYLESTNWYVFRAFETGQPIPANIKQARAAARANIPEQGQ